MIYLAFAALVLAILALWVAYERGREIDLLRLQLDEERERASRYHDDSLAWANNAYQTCYDWMAEVEDLRQHHGLFPAERS